MLSAIAVVAVLPITDVHADDVGRAENDAVALESAIATRLACIQQHDAALERTASLLTDTRRQLRASNASPAARADAVRAVESLRQSLVQAQATFDACLRSAPSFGAGDRTPEGRAIVYVERPDDTADRVARENPATEVIEQDTMLGGGVRIVVGERVDGHGRVTARAVKTAVGRIGPRLSACRTAARGSATAILVFTITPAGRVQRVHVEANTGPAELAACIARAGRALTIDEPALGGDVTYSYSLAY